ncbi:hypothetical protein FD644_17810 [Serratia fonticola]|uniref:hypothetical protein n=1 Tax=Serratia fonticola TaxID=47917 RepID=UPI0010CD5B2D|nr:hypothetical protein [Serratia fonticola]QCR62094.1 hypothetical protein FD644_17810 [Serratia fonticola]
MEKKSVKSISQGETSNVGKAPSAHVVVPNPPDNTPAFGFDADNELVSGFDKGSHTNGDVNHG